MHVTFTSQKETLHDVSIKAICSTTCLDQSAPLQAECRQ